MANVKLPHYEALVATTDTTVTIDGNPPRVHLTSAPSSATAYAWGRNATISGAAADETWPVYPSPGEPLCIATTGGALGGASSLHLYSAGTPTVAVLPCDCD